jgi:hypothetical protein
MRTTTNAEMEGMFEREFQRLANKGFEVEINRAIERAFGGRDIPYTEENARKLERYLKLNPGGTGPIDIKITRHIPGKDDK